MSVRSFAAVAMLALAAPLAAQDAPPAPEGPLSLDLMCMGRGTLHKTRQVPDGRDKKGNRRTRSQSYDEPFGGGLRIRIRGNQADALPPEPMLSQVRESGWREIKKLAVSAGAIEGKIDLGFLYAPVFRIDRYAGTISLSGSMSTFEGSCQPYEASERQF